MAARSLNPIWALSPGSQIGVAAAARIDAITPSPPGRALRGGGPKPHPLWLTHAAIAHSMGPKFSQCITVHNSVIFHPKIELSSCLYPPECPMHVRHFGRLIHLGTRMIENMGLELAFKSYTTCIYYLKEAG
jgi:hypothetical protein